MQLGLIEEKIEQMQLIKTALVDASKAVKQEKNVDWSKMMQLVNVNEMEHKLKVPVSELIKYLGKDKSS